MLNHNPDSLEKYNLIKFKSYKTKNFSEFGSLTVPSEAFEGQLNIIFDEFQKIFELVKSNINILETHIFPMIDGKIIQWPGCNDKSLVVKRVLIILLRIKIKRVNDSVKTKDKSMRKSIVEGR